MPYRLSVPCKHPRCPALVPYGSGPYCDEHKAAYQGDRENASRRGYNSRWQKARVRYLHSHPLCVECKKAGKLTQATVVDHIVPHRGDQKLFWDEGNWQPLCKPCHDKKTWNEDNNPTVRSTKGIFIFKSITHRKGRETRRLEIKEKLRAFMYRRIIRPLSAKKNGSRYKSSCNIIKSKEIFKAVISTKEGIQ